jgi:glycerophosphoryl diester phosphodiesterase
VRLARDGIPVVIHDATLRRTGLTRGSIRRLDSKRLAEIDVGSWFNRAYPRLARREYAEERLPTLAQVFELCRKNSAIIYVEMKSETNDSVDDLAHAVANLIKVFKFRARVVVSSFNLAAIATVRNVDSSIRTGALFGSTGMSSRSWRDNLLGRAADCGANELLLHRLIARRKLIERAHKHDLAPVVWTVDDAKWVARAQILRLHALITNQPAKMLVMR